MFNNEIIQKHYKDIVVITYRQLNRIPLPNTELNGMIRSNFMMWIGVLYLELVATSITNNNRKRLAMLYLKCFYTAIKYVFKKEEKIELPGLGITIRQMFNVMDQSQIAPYIDTQYKHYLERRLDIYTGMSKNTILSKAYNDVSAIIFKHFNNALDAFVNSEYDTDEYIFSIRNTEVFSSMDNEMFKDNIIKSVTDELQQQLDVATKRDINSCISYVNRYSLDELDKNFNISIYITAHNNNCDVQQTSLDWYNDKVTDVESNEVKINTNKENNKIERNDKIEAINNIQVLMNIVEKQSKQIAELTSIIKTLVEHKE